MARVIHYIAGDTGGGGPLQGVGGGGRGEDGGDGPVLDGSGPLRVDQSLEIGAAAGDEYGDPLHTSTTPSSPLTTEPMM